MSDQTSMREVLRRKLQQGWIAMVPVGDGDVWIEEIESTFYSPGTPSAHDFIGVQSETRKGGIVVWYLAKKNEGLKGWLVRKAGSVYNNLGAMSVLIINSIGKEPQRMPKISYKLTESESRSGSEIDGLVDWFFTYFNIDDGDILELDVGRAPSI